MKSPRLPRCDYFKYTIPDVAKGVPQAQPCDALADGLMAKSSLLFWCEMSLIGASRVFVRRVVMPAIRAAADVLGCQSG
jgi:hypothetical protein